MEDKKYKPLVGRMFYVISIPTLLLLLAVTVLAAFEPIALLIIIPVDLFTVYFLISPLFGSVTLTGDAVVIKFGFFLTRAVPYTAIRSVEKQRRWYADSMLSLKNSMEHVNIKYNRFDILSVSVVGNDAFTEELYRRMKGE